MKGHLVQGSDPPSGGLAARSGLARVSALLPVAVLECENDEGGRFTNRRSGDSHRTFRASACAVATCGLAPRKGVERRFERRRTRWPTGWPVGCTASPTADGTGRDPSRLAVSPSRTGLLDRERPPGRVGRACPSQPSPMPALGIETGGSLPSTAANARASRPFGRLRHKRNDASNL